MAPKASVPWAVSWFRTIVLSSWVLLQHRHQVGAVAAGLWRFRQESEAIEPRPGCTPDITNFAASTSKHHSGLKYRMPSKLTLVTLTQSSSRLFAEPGWSGSIGAVWSLTTAKPPDLQLCVQVELQIRCSAYFLDAT